MKIRYSAALVLLCVFSCRSSFEGYREFDLENNAFSSFSDFSQFDKKKRRGRYDPHLEYKKEKSWDWGLRTDTFRKSVLSD